MSEFQFVAKRLDRAQHVRRMFCHVLPEGCPYTRALEPSYWANVIGNRTQNNRIEAGDRIEIYTADRQIAFELFLLDANQWASPPRFVYRARPISPVDLKLPIVVQDEVRFRIRQSLGGLFEIVELRTGRTMATNIADQDAAQRTLAMLEQTAAAAAPEPEHDDDQPAKRGRGRPPKPRQEPEPEQATA